MAFSSSIIVQVKEAENEDEGLHYTLARIKMSGKCIHIASWDTAKLIPISHSTHSNYIAITQSNFINFYYTLKINSNHIQN